MGKKPRLRRPSHATAVAYLALFVALGGTTAYATHETIFSSDIVDGEVKTADIGTSAVSNPKILGGAVTSGKVANGTLKPEDHGTIPAAKVYKTDVQNAGSNTSTTLTFNAERFDYGDLHSNVTDNSRLTAPISGVYQVNAGVWWADTNSTGNRILTIHAPGLETVTETAGIATPGNSHQSVSGLVRLVAGQYVVAQVNQSSGTPRPVSGAGTGTHLSMHWVGPLP